ncbi:MAG: enoyl-CoA hydratase/isomerase family protein [Gammaproteobacteria bacterium]|nr:enoyl-CoA hydratase/isomerase family protein [Gammaproteobacteria bacterium]
MKQELLFEVDEGVALITFNRAEARNALTFGMYQQLADHCNEANRDEAIKVLIITGDGNRAFAAGTDIAQFRDFQSAADGLAYERHMDSVLSTLETCTVPTIAAITGACTGGGAAIAACCDLRIADRSLKFGFPIARTLGNCLSNASLQRLIWLLGAGRTREIIFTARLIEADEALAIGLVSALLETPQEVLPQARSLAEKIKSFAPLTLKATKQSMQRLRDQGHAAEDEDLIALCYTSEDFHEGLDAFLNKRKPQWKGR